MNYDLENRLWICCFLDSDFVFLNFIIFPICYILKFHHVVPSPHEKSNLIQNMKIYSESIFSSFLIHVFVFTTSPYGNVHLICYMFKSHHIIFSLCYVSTFSHVSPSPRDKFIITWTVKSLYAISSKYYISVLFCFTLSPLDNYNLNFLVSTLYLVPNIILLHGNPLPLPNKYTSDAAPFGPFQRHCVPPLLCYLLNCLLMFKILYIFVYIVLIDLFIYLIPHLHLAIISYLGQSCTHTYQRHTCTCMTLAFLCKYRLYTICIHLECFMKYINCDELQIFPYMLYYSRFLPDKCIKYNLILMLSHPVYSKLCKIMNFEYLHNRTQRFLSEHAVLRFITEINRPSFTIPYLLCSSASDTYNCISIGSIQLIYPKCTYTTMYNYLYDYIYVCMLFTINTMHYLFRKPFKRSYIIDSSKAARNNNAFYSYINGSAEITSLYVLVGYQIYLKRMYTYLYTFRYIVISTLFSGNLNTGRVENKVCHEILIRKNVIMTRANREKNFGGDYLRIRGNYITSNYGSANYYVTELKCYSIYNCLSLLQRLYMYFNLYIYVLLRYENVHVLLSVIATCIMKDLPHVCSYIYCILYYSYVHTLTNKLFSVRFKVIMDHIFINHADTQISQHLYNGHWYELLHCKIIVKPIFCGCFICYYPSRIDNVQCLFVFVCMYDCSCISRTLSYYDSKTYTCTSIRPGACIIYIINNINLIGLYNPCIMKGRGGVYINNIMTTQLNDIISQVFNYYPMYMQICMSCTLSISCTLLSNSYMIVYLYMSYETTRMQYLYEHKGKFRGVGIMLYPLLLGVYLTYTDYG